MKLTFTERLVMSGVVPEMGNMINMILAKEILAKVNPTAEEINKSGLKPSPDGKVEYKDNVIPEIEVKFDKAEISLLKERVEILDREGKISLQNLSVCEKIKSL